MISISPVISLAGGPGAGKGSQCSLLCGKYGYSHLSTGDLLREEVRKGTERWVRLYDIMDKGALVPDVRFLILITRNILLPRMR